MRTTLTIDDQVARSLRETAHRSGRPFKQVVNETLRKGLQALGQPEAKPYRLPTASLGGVRPDVSLDKALTLVETLEDAAIAMKLELRK